MAATALVSGQFHTLGDFPPGTEHAVEPLEPVYSL
jgi:hypothetical protein